MNYHDKAKTGWLFWLIFRVVSVFQDEIPQRRHDRGGGGLGGDALDQR